jgi:hypothetical protein
MDLDKFLSERGINIPAEAPAAAAPSLAKPTQPIAPKMSELEFEAYTNRFIDPLTGDPKPVYVSGATPEFAVTQSPLSPEERLMMSPGNRQGTINFLNQKFDAVAEDKRGNLVVLKDNQWMQVDPEGTGSGDAWQRSKEVLNDLADIAPEAAAIIGSGVAAYMTGGASLLAQAGTLGAVGGLSGLLRTSLGRLAGTYEAEPEEQLADIATEGMLNSLGVYIAPGVKLGMGAVTKAISKMPSLPGLGGVPEAVKDVAAMMWGEATGVGAGNIRHMADRPAQVAAITSRVSKAVTGTTGQIDAIRGEQITQAADLLEGIVSGRAKAQRQALNGVINSVDDSVSVSGKDFRAPMAKFWGDLGLVDSAGAPVKEKVMLANLDTMMQTSPDEGIRQLAGGLANSLRSGNKGAAYRKVVGHIEQFNASTSFDTRTGKNAVLSAIDVDQSVTRTTWDNSGAAYKDSLKGVADWMSMSKAKFLGTEADDASVGGLDRLMRNKLGATADAYSAAKRQWATDSKEFGMILKAAEQARKTGGDSAEAVVNRLASGAGKNVRLQTKLNNAANQFGLSDQYYGILDREAAIAMTSPLNKTMVKFGPTLAIAGAAGAGFSGSGEGNRGVGTALGAGVGLALTSPKLAGKLITGTRMRNLFSTMDKGSMQAATKQGFDMLSTMKLTNQMQKLNKMPPEQAAAARSLAIQSWLQTFRPQLTELTTGE